jgi:hypothetical protein
MLHHIYQWFFHGKIFTILWILEEKIGEMCLFRKKFTTHDVNLKFEKKEKKKKSAFDESFM